MASIKVKGKLPAQVERDSRPKLNKNEGVQPSDVIKSGGFKICDCGGQHQILKDSVSCPYDGGPESVRS